MLTDFNKAQELLKQKIALLTAEKDDYHDKYHNRESRAEDLEEIEILTVRDFSNPFETQSV